MSINLLPGRSPEKETEERILTLVGGALIITCLLMVGGTGYLWLDKTTLTDTIAVKQEEKTAIEQEIQKTRTQQLELALIEDRGSAFAKLEKSDPELIRLLDEVAHATPQNVRINTFGLKEAAEIGITGIGASRADIAAFTENLSQSDVFTRVTLAQTDTQTDGVHFTVSLTIAGAQAAASPVPATQSESSSL